MSLPPKSSEYTNITSIEQRRRYKTEFDSDYSDYRKLHSENERVSNCFSKLEDQLRQVNPNDQRYKVCFITYAIY